MAKNRQLILAKTFDRRGKQIAAAFNDYSKSHPIMKHYAEMVGLDDKIFLHAEILAILRSGDTAIHTITVERYGKSGQMLLAKPCPVCMAAIRAYGISKVKFTSENGWQMLDVSAI